MHTAEFRMLSSFWRIRLRKYLFESNYNKKTFELFREREEVFSTVECTVLFLGILGWLKINKYLISELR